MLVSFLIAVFLTPAALYAKLKYFVLSLGLAIITLFSAHLAADKRQGNDTRGYGLFFGGAC